MRKKEVVRSMHIVTSPRGGLFYPKVQGFIEEGDRLGFTFLDSTTKKRAAAVFYTKNILGYIIEEGGENE